MRQHPFRIFFGVTLLAVAGVALAVNIFRLTLPPQAWLLLGGGLGILAFLLAGVGRRWALLLAGGPIMAAVVVGALLYVRSEVYGIWFPALCGAGLLAVGAPFVGLYLDSHERWGWLFPGYAFLLAGEFSLYVGWASFMTDWEITFIAWGIALPFMLIFAGNKKAWWALTIGYLLLVLGAGWQIANRRADQMVTWLFWSVALLFWLAYLRDVERGRTLATAGVLTIVGGVPLLFNAQPAFWFWVSAGVMGGIGLVWLVAILRRRLNPKTP